MTRTEPNPDPLWYKDAVIYELHVKTFFDSSGDGMGDFRGLAEKLDYLEWLGVTAIWLLPFYPSPLRDDGYDIADYYSVHPSYGDLRDFRAFLREAHRRGIRVITELVLNHTSDRHPWFQRARQAKPGSVHRDFYVWSDTPDRYRDARIIFKDFEHSNWAWDPVAQAYYWHRFYSHQPDLNFANPAVRRELKKVIDFWFELGVDGVRLDAVPYLFEREGTNCENLSETYDFLRELRAHVDKKFSNRMLLAEANQWPEDAVAYFGTGDLCHMAFHFPLMPRLFMALQMEDAFPVIDILEQTPAIPESAQWALFLRNHDELTLEMVTDEERDYMYHAFARDRTARINLGIRRRLAPLLGNNRRRLELMNLLLMSLPGTPVLYYGDEIGMGDNYYLGDRDGVRTPMQWSSDRNGGFSRANPQQLYLPAIIDPEYHYETVNVENHQHNQSSLLWWTKRVLAMRARYRAFGRGDLEFIATGNPKVLAFLRRHGEEHLLIVVNLSRYAQVADLELAQYAGWNPVEMFSRNRFPLIQGASYTLTLGIHDCYWFVLEKQEDAQRVRAQHETAPLAVPGPWENVLQGKARQHLERELLPRYLATCRWFGGRSRVVQQLRISDIVPLTDGVSALLAWLEVGYVEGQPETYLLALTFASGGSAEHTASHHPEAVIGRLRCADGEGVLFDAVYCRYFRGALMRMFRRKGALRGIAGELFAQPSNALRRAEKMRLPVSKVINAQQSNTAVRYGRRYFLKFFRKLAEGEHPELELGRYLTEQAKFPHIAPYAGMLTYRRPGAEQVVVGVLQQFVPHRGEAWQLVLDAIGVYCELVLSRRSELAGQTPPVWEKITGPGDLPPLMQELLGWFVPDKIVLLGRRTAELHRALAAGTDEAFAPEPFTAHYQRSICHAMITGMKRALDGLQATLPTLPVTMQPQANMLLAQEKEVGALYRRLLALDIRAQKIRIHGDYHLGQVLFTGSDFILIDFEGEPARSIGERRLKRSPLRDVAGMLRSFNYAACHVLYTSPVFTPEDVRCLQPWLERWYDVMRDLFLAGYRAAAGDAPFLPRSEKTLAVMLHCYLLEKAFYEVDYELRYRPEWLPIPMAGLSRLLADKP